MALLNNQFIISGAQVPDTGAAISDGIQAGQNAKFNQMKIAAAQQQAAQAADLQNLRVQAGGDTSKFIQLAGAKGYDTSEFQKALDTSNQSQATTAKTQLDTNDARLTALNNGMSSVLSNPTVVNAHDNINKLQQMGILTQDQAVAAHSSVPTADSDITKWAQGAALGSMKDGGQLAATNPKSTQLGLGNRNVQLLENPLTGTQTIGATYGIGQSPDNAANNATTRRGQDITTATARDKNSQQNDKPAPTSLIELGQTTRNSLLKSQQDGSQMQTMLDDIGSGKLPIGRLSNAWSAARNWAGYSSPESTAYANLQNNLKNMANNILQASKGTQTEGDAQRAYDLVSGGISDPATLTQTIKKMQQMNTQLQGSYQATLGDINRNYHLPSTQGNYQGRPANPDTQTVSNPFSGSQQQSQPQSSFAVQQNGNQTVINGRSYSGAQIEAYGRKYGMTKDQVISMINSHK